MGHVVYVGARDAVSGLRVADELGAEIIMRMATIGPDGPTGTFVEAAGAAPW